jgi:hypothetical protein
MVNGNGSVSELYTPRPAGSDGHEKTQEIRQEETLPPSGTDLALFATGGFKS